MTTKVKKERSVKDYENLTEREHALQRAGMYMGQLSQQELQRMIFNPDSRRYEPKTLLLSEGFETIFDEILVNAADQQNKDPKMTEIRVSIFKDHLVIQNNGQGLPLDEKKEVKSTGESVWLPTMLFARFRSSENFNNERQGAGLNGVGAKIANCYCKVLTCETQHPKSKKYFSQTWRDNMLIEDKPIRRGLTSDDEKGGFVRVTMYPDFEKFEMLDIDSDTMKLLRSRVYDVAGFMRPGISVYLNDELVPVRSFSEYADLIFGPDVPRVTFALKDTENKAITRVELAIARSEDGFRCHGLINGLRTPDGTHVKTIITDKLGKSVIDNLSRRREYKDLKFQPQQFKDQVSLLIKMTVDNPEFNSQRKTEFISKPDTWGFPLEFPAAFLKKLEGSELGIVDAMIALKSFKESKAFAAAVKTGRKGRITDIDKFHDATSAGKAGRFRTLILTEGDSAKGLAQEGIVVLDNKDDFGLYPLRGKILNVREKSIADMASSEVITNLLRIMGLEFGKTYKSLDELRYQRIVIWTDADPDGAHILGLILNLIEYGWKSLLESCPDLCYMMSSPIAKATPTSRGKDVTYFFTEHNIVQWRKNTPASVVKAHEIRWLKGLGSSDPKDAKYYFRNIDKFAVPLRYTGAESSAVIDMVFNKKKGSADARKDWINTVYNPNSFLPLGEDIDHITWPDFFHKHFIHFSVFDTARSLPRIMDGLKPSQRKVMWTMIQQNVTVPKRVISLMGTVMEKASYHSGDASLSEVIITLSQRHIGTNNINMLQPSGVFGNRASPRSGAQSNHAAPRYIFSSLEPITKTIFSKADESLLEYMQDDDGKPIEPRTYMPVVPMILINGSGGIGTGWSCDVPRYNPKDIINEVRSRLLNWEHFAAGFESQLYGGEATVIEDMSDPNNWPPTLTPWYDLFSGDTERVQAYGFELKGKFTRTKNTVLVSELPPEIYTENWKARVEAQCLIGNVEKKAKKVKAKKAKAGGKKGKGAGKKGKAKAKGTGKAKGAGKAKAPGKKAGPKTAEVASPEDMSELNDVQLAKPAAKSSKNEFVKDIIPELAGVQHVSVLFKCDEEALAKLSDAEVQHLLQLNTRVSFNNVYCFDINSKLKKFKSPEDLIDYFCYYRYPLFEKRRALMLEQLQYDSVELRNKRRYLEMVMGYGGQKPYNVGGKTIQQVSAELEKLGFDKLKLRPKYQDPENKGDNVASYWYLGKLQQWSTTEDKINRLRKECDEVLAKLMQLEKSSPVELWLADLSEFEAAYADFLKEKKLALSDDDEEFKKQAGKPKGKGKKGDGPAPKKRKSGAAASGAKRLKVSKDDE